MNNHIYSVQNDSMHYSQAIPVFALAHDDTFIEAQVRFERKAVKELTQKYQKHKASYKKLLTVALSLL